MEIMVLLNSTNSSIYTMSLDVHLHDVFSPDFFIFLNASFVTQHKFRIFTGQNIALSIFQETRQKQVPEEIYDNGHLHEPKWTNPL